MKSHTFTLYNDSAYHHHCPLTMEDKNDSSRLPGKPDLAKHLADKQRYAGEKIPSMTRRRNGHDYAARRMYLITLTIEGRYQQGA